MPKFYEICALWVVSQFHNYHCKTLLLIPAADPHLCRAIKTGTLVLVTEVGIILPPRRVSYTANDMLQVLQY